MITGYTKIFINTIVSTDNSAENRNSFDWGIKGFRSHPSEVYQTLRSLHQFPFDDRKTIRDESRRLALYCPDDNFTSPFLRDKMKLRRAELNDFCECYGVDLKRRNLVNGGAK